MYHPGSLLARPHNLYGCALAMDNAQNAKFYDVTAPFLTSDGPMPLVARHQYGSGLSPSLLVYSGFGRVAVAIAGIQGAADALRVYQGYLSPQAIFSHRGKVNAYAKAWTEAAWPTVEPFVAGAARSWVFIGHSWGSAVATIMANQVKKLDPTRYVSVATYGAPRFADRLYLDGLHVNEHVRVHNHGDPIPFVIPWFTEAPFFHSIHSTLHIIRMNTFAHGGHGIRIQRGQQIDVTDQRSGYVYPLEFNPLRMRDLMANGVEPHLTDSYVEILQAYAEGAIRTHGVVQEAMGQAKGEQPPMIKEVDAEQIAEYPKQGWPKEPAGPNGAPPVPPPMVLTPKWDAPASRRKGVHVRREGRLWYVYSGDVQVYKATGKADAYGWGRSLRRFAHQYRQNPSGVVNPDALAEAVAGFQPLSS